jgi:hypothetical protein
MLLHDVGTKDVLVDEPGGDVVGKKGRVPEFEPEVNGCKIGLFNGMYALVV